MVSNRPTQSSCWRRPIAPMCSMLLADLTLRAWEDLLAAELSQRPIALFVDDAQWADAPSMRLIEASLRNGAYAPDSGKLFSLVRPS